MPGDPILEDQERETEFSGDDPEYDGENRTWLCELLGVTPESVHHSFWEWMDQNGPYEDVKPLVRAAGVAKSKRNPVGYFQKILPQFIEERRAA